MSSMRSQLAAFASVLLFVAGATQIAAAADAPALTGTVTSAEEGAMEGVLVSAKKAGSTMTITVVSDAKGAYRFPASKLEAGQYRISIRAIGYDLDGRANADIAAQKTATVDLKLRKTADLAAQMSNSEWLNSMPGSDKQKYTLLGCVGCHSLERIVRSKYDADGFLATVQRMSTYANQTTPLNPQKRLTTRDTEPVGEDRVRVQRAQAEFLASVNLSQTSTWEYALKTLPRPKGKATQVIYTEYDLPRPTLQPHDVVLDPEGNAWYSNFGGQTLGKIDPKTGKHTEFPVPELKKGSPVGALSLRNDRDGNLWLGLMYQSAVAKFDRKSEKFQTFMIPAEMNKANTQVNMTSPWNMAVDGKVWSQNNGFAGIHRIDLKTGKWETWEPFKSSPQGHNIYDVVADSKNNAYFTDIGREHVGRIDAKTGEITMFATPTKDSGPRRGMMDDQDRLWFGEYRANAIAVFDTKSAEFKEWKLPLAWANPYDVTVDKNGHAWTGSMINDRITRLDPKTGQFTDYLLPKQTNVRRVYVDNTTTPVTFWVGSNHGASIVKLEPLE